jgi:hypothetical protein
LPSFYELYTKNEDRLYGLVVRVPGCYPEDPSSIPCATRFSEEQWVWNGIHSAFLRINEKLLERE